MSGHSKWATIKRKKGALDAKKGQLFTKLVREITTAARLGGGDIHANPRLRAAVAAAKAQRMPSDTIERGIKKGTGALEGPPVEEVLYEGYAPGGVAILVEALTDNRNRTSSEIRAALTKGGGKLGAAGSVGWMFQKQGRLVFDAQHCSEDTLMEVAFDAGAQNLWKEEESCIVTCDPKLFATLLEAFEHKGIPCETAELTLVPDTTVKVGGLEAEKVLQLMERLEDLDDVQKVYANFEIDDSELERIAAATG